MMADPRQGKAHLALFLRGSSDGHLDGEPKQTGTSMLAECKDRLQRYAKRYAKTGLRIDLTKYILRIQMVECL